MKKTFQEIADEVRMIIDENEDNSALIDEADEVANDTDKITKQMIMQSVDMVHQMAPLWKTTDVQTQTTVSLQKYRKGKAGAVPGDFLRFVAADADDWSHKVYEPITEGSAEYQMQASEWAGIRGSAERPVVAIVPGLIGMNMEVYTTDKDAATLAYIRKAKAEKGGVMIADMCYKAVLNMVAKYYMVSVGEAERAAHYNAVVNELLGINTNSE